MYPSTMMWRIAISASSTLPTISPTPRNTPSANSFTSVWPHVARGVCQEPVPEGENLPLLVRAVAAVALGGPGAIEDVAEPGAGPLRMADRLAHRQIRESIRPDDARVVVAGPVAKRVDDAAVDRIALPGHGAPPTVI